MTTAREFHPVSQIFPLMHGREFDELVSDIRTHGLREPVWLHADGRVIDGRNRYRACLELGIEPETRVYDGDDAELIAFIVSLNLHRRHLDESQRGMVHARIATLPKGVRSDTAIAVSVPTQKQAAAMLNISVDSGQRARKVLETGAPELARAVDEGRVSVSAAADVASLAPEEQREVVAHGEKEIIAKAKEIRARKVRSRIEARKQRFASTIEDGCTVEDLNALIARGKKFDVIYADPPWKFHVYSGAGKERSAENQYDTMSLADICALPIEQLASEDCALFLWGVWPEMPGALEVIKAWGFDYKTCAFNWLKTNRSGEGLFTGMGYWTRANSELCLLATRGNPLRIAMDVHQVIMSPVAEHSRKPDEARARIERLLCGPYLELFARRVVPGWTVWGKEIPRGVLEGAA